VTLNNNIELIENLKNKIYNIRNLPVMLDSDLAKFYAIHTSVLNQAVKRNKDRFPKDFMFQLTLEEFKNLKHNNNLISQFVISKTERGGRKKLPFVFTEHGVAMLSGILKSDRAIKINIQIMRAFVDMRKVIKNNTELF
jgi:hypothetical protein